MSSELWSRVVDLHGEGVGAGCFCFDCFLRKAEETMTSVEVQDIEHLFLFCKTSRGPTDIIKPRGSHSGELIEEE